MLWFSVNQLTCHTGLTHRHSHPTLEFTACSAWLYVGWLWDDNVLAGVVVGGALTFVFCFLDGSLFVALIQV